MSCKPTIVVFTTAYHPFIGGAEIAIQEVAKRLHKEFDFLIITSRFRRDLPRREVRPEGTVVRLGFGTRFDKWLLPFYAPWFLARILFSDFVPDWIGDRISDLARPKGLVLWGIDISQGAFAASIVKLLCPRIPFMLNIQYGYGEERLARGRLGMTARAFRFILSRADYVTAISSYLLGMARRYGYCGPVEVAHNGVDLEKFKNKNEKLKTTNKNQKIVITTSRLVPKNGIDILIQAIAEVKKTIPDIQCHIIGDGPERTSYQLLATRCQVENNVKFFGEIPHEQLPRHLHEADLFVRPSRSEGMGNSFVEALAAGLPIIGTPVGGITDIIKDGETGLFTKVDDPHDLAEKMRLLLEDKALAEKIAARGRAMVREQFSWDTIAEWYHVLLLRGLASYSYEDRPRRGLRVVVATPLFPPQLGGPANYAEHLGDAFRAAGHEVRVAPFGEFLRYPSGIRHLLYFFKLLRAGVRCDVLFVLDQFSVGLPAALVALILRKPFVLRLEGDFLWERFVERTRRDCTLREFYDIPQPLILGERIIAAFIRWAVRRAARVVVSSAWRREIAVQAFGLPPHRFDIIANVAPRSHEAPSSDISRKAQVLWAGRMLYLKNLYRLIRAFARIGRSDYTLKLVGDGPERRRLIAWVREQRIERVIFSPPMRHDELFEEMRRSAFVVLPSLSDVWPNIIVESVAAQTPFIITKKSGYAASFQNAGFFMVDPRDEEDIADKMARLMDVNTQEHQCVLLRNFPLERTWEEAAGEWIGLFSKLLGVGNSSPNDAQGLRIAVIGRDPELFNQGSEAFRRVKEYAAFLGELHIVAMTAPGMAPFVEGNLFLWPTNSRLTGKRWWDAYQLARRLVRERGIHLLDAQDPGESGLAAFMAARMSGIPFRLQIHTDILSPWYRQASWKERVRYYLAKFLIPRADCVRVVSERIRNLILRKSDFPREVGLPDITVRGGKVRFPKITVLPIYTDVSRFLTAVLDPRTEGRFRGYDFKMIAVGRMVEKEKHFSMLIEMMREVVKKYPKALLVIVGDGSHRESYKLQATSYKLERNVILEPSRSDLPSFYKSFDLFLLSSNYEGWGRVVIEAMAAGLPVVMTDVGLAGEVVENGKNGIVVPVGDTVAMTSAVLRLIKDKTERERLIAEGHIAVKRLAAFSKDQYLEAYVRSFLSCMR